MSGWDDYFAPTPTMGAVSAPTGWDSYFSDPAPQPSIGGSSWDSYLPSSPLAPEPEPEHDAFWDEESVLENILDTINSPQQALFGLASRKSSESTWDSMLRGMQTNMSGIDLMSRATGTPINRMDPLSKGTGTLLSFIADPLAAIPEQWVGKGISTVAKPIIGAATEVLKHSDTFVAIAKRIDRTAFMSKEFKDFVNMEDLALAKKELAEAVIKKEAGAARMAEKPMAGYDAPTVMQFTRLAKESKTPGAPLPKIIDEIDKIIATPEVSDAFVHYKNIAHMTGDDTFMDLMGSQPSKELWDTLAQKAATALQARKADYLATTDVSKILDEDALKKFYGSRGVPEVPPIKVTEKTSQEFGVLFDEPHTGQFSTKPGTIQTRAPGEYIVTMGDGSRRLLDQAEIDEYFKINPTSQAAVPPASVLTETDEVMKVTNAVDRLPQDIIDNTLQYKKAMDDAYLLERGLGAKTRYLDDTKVDYLTHMLTPEAKKQVLKIYESVTGTRKYSPAHVNQLARDLRGMGIDEINKLAKTGDLPGKFAGIKVDKFFEDDLIAITAFRRMRAAKIEADYEMLRKAAEQFGKVGDDVPADWVDLQITHKTDPRFEGVVREFKGIKFHPEIATHLNATVDFMVTPEATGGFVRLLEGVRGVWAPMTLFSPLGVIPTTLKNVVGNVFNNMLAGVRSPKFYRIMMELQKRDSTLTEIVLNGKKYSREAIKKLMDNMAVSGMDYGTAELEAFTKAYGKESPLFKAPLGIGKYFRNMQHGYRLVEDNARGAHFLHMLDKGLDPMAARLSVRKYLFDYNVARMMPWEKNLRLIMPFFSWTRNNIPLQLQSLISNPTNRAYVRLAELTTAAKHFQSGDEPEQRLDGFHRNILPEFVREQVGIPIRLDDNGDPTYFMLGYWIPAGELESIMSPKSVIRKAYNMLAPYFKAPIEQGYNYDGFLQRKIEEFPGETQKWMRMDVPRRLVHLTKLFRFVNELDVMTRGAMDGTLTHQEKDVFDKIMRGLTGATTYTVNVPYQQKKHQREIDRIVSRLERENNPANQEALTEYLQELVEE